MAVRKLTQAGHHALKAKNTFVKDFNSSKLKRVIKDLKDTMYETGLVGIAAPQIGVNEMIFVTHPRNTKDRKLIVEDTYRVYINPKVISSSKEKVVIYEGCGSIANGNLFGPVERPKSITVEAIDENGKRFSLTCDGLLARVILHEVDHLQGIEYIQKVQDYNCMLDETYYRKYIRSSKKQKDALTITHVDLSA